MKNPVNPRIPGFLIEFGTQKVESEGFEPSSKQAINIAFFTLSFHLVVDARPAENHQSYTYSHLSFRITSRPYNSYIYFIDTSSVNAVNQGFHEASRLPT